MEELQARYQWFHSSSMEEKFMLFPKPIIIEMLTQEEKFGFLNDLYRKNFLFPLCMKALFDWKFVSRWRSNFQIYLFQKNPELISDYIQLVYGGRYLS